MTRALLTIALALWASSAFAQTGAPTSWTMKLYQAGSANVFQVFIVTRQQATCGQAADPNWPPPPVLNPDSVVWDDPFSAGRVCWFNDAARFDALPDGNYEGTATAVNSDGASAETARVPFVRRRPNPPAVPTGTKFIRQAP